MPELNVFFLPKPIRLYLPFNRASIFKLINKSFCLGEGWFVFTSTAKKLQKM